MNYTTAPESTPSIPVGRLLFLLNVISLLRLCEIAHSAQVQEVDLTEKK